MLDGHVAVIIPHVVSDAVHEDLLFLSGIIILIVSQHVLQSQVTADGFGSRLEDLVGDMSWHPERTRVGRP